MEKDKGVDAALKKKVLTLFAVLLCALVVLNVTALADFGDFSGSSDYDFSYDYNDDWSSGDSDSDWSGGGDIFIFGGGGDGIDFWTILAVIVIIIIVAQVFGKDKKGKGGSSVGKNARRAERAESRANRAALTPIGEYAKIDPVFNAAALCEKASNLYVQMQNAWTAKNIESLRPYFTDALFTQMERSLQG